MKKVLCHMPAYKLLPKALNNFLDIATANNYCIFVYQPSNIKKVPQSGITTEGKFNIFEKMERVRQIAINEKFDYIFNVEHDNIIPKNALLQLLTDNKPIVGGIYRFRSSCDKRVPLMYIPLTGKCTNTLLDGLQQVKLVPWGCTLFSRSVFTKIPFTEGLDEAYATTCEKASIERWIDFDVKVGHIDHESPSMDVVWP